MKKIRVLIVDDEPLAREGVEVLLRDEPAFEVVGSCADGKSALAQIQAERPELVFLDVHMPQLSGLDVYAQLAAPERPAVIFITAYDQHAVRAFEVCAVDYLVKPFRNERFRSALARARDQIFRADLEEMHRRAMELVETLRNVDETSISGASRTGRLVFKVGNEHLFVSAADIAWIEACSELVKVKAGVQIHLVRESLTAIERRLDPEVFVRIHRSFVVNARRIKKVTPALYGDHEILMEDGTKIRMSRTHRDRLNRLLSGSKV